MPANLANERPKCEIFDGRHGSVISITDTCRALDYIAFAFGAGAVPSKRMKVQTKRLLHIDEHGEDRVRMRASLLEHIPDLEVHEASSGLQALQAIHMLQLHCVLLDLKLRDIIGMELVRVIQSELRNIPIVVWTGLNHDMLRQAAMSMGVHSHFLKRRDDQDVVFAIKRVLA